MKLLLCAALIVMGLVGGAAIGHLLRPNSGSATQAPASPPSGPSDYVEIARQMIVPVVAGGETEALMIFEVALDVPASARERAFQREPRIRDAFLREMFEMSYAGAFADTYTSERVMEELRARLLAAARLHLGQRVRDVLILDALRQEL
ncbi:MAG: flagellar basal body-associated FliL family protein [Pikeienuella sp.]